MLVPRDGRTYKGSWLPCLDLSLCSLLVHYPRSSVAILAQGNERLPQKMAAPPDDIADGVCICLKIGLPTKLIDQCSQTKAPQRALFPLENSEVSEEDVHVLFEPLRELIKMFPGGVLSPTQVLGGLMKFNTHVEGKLTRGMLKKREQKAFLMGEAVKLVDVWSFLRRRWRKATGSKNPEVLELKLLMEKKTSTVRKSLCDKITAYQAEAGCGTSDKVEALLDELDAVKSMSASDMLVLEGAYVDSSEEQMFEDFAGFAAIEDLDDKMGVEDGGCVVAKDGGSVLMVNP